MRCEGRQLIHDVISNSDSYRGEIDGFVAGFMFLKLLLPLQYTKRQILKKNLTVCLSNSICVYFDKMIKLVVSPIQKLPHRKFSHFCM